MAVQGLKPRSISKSNVFYYKHRKEEKSNILQIPNQEDEINKVTEIASEGLGTTLYQ